MKFLDQLRRNLGSAEMLFPKEEAAPVASPEASNISDRLSDDPIRNGINATRLLNDPLLKQTFKDVRTAILRKFEDISADDMEALRLNRLSLTALDNVRQMLLVYQFNGQTAEQKAEKDGTADIKAASRPRGK